MTAVSDALAPIRARAEAATEGPWGHQSHGTGIRGGGSYDFITLAGSRGIIAERSPSGTPADAAFIAAARTDIPRLIQALEAVTKVHEPVDALMNPGRYERVVKVCTGCGTDDGNWQRWPCPTITAITAVLGGGE